MITGPDRTRIYEQAQGAPPRRGRRASPGTEGESTVRRVEDQPLRAELFSISQLERHTRTMAGWHEVERTPGRGGDRLLARLGENERVFSEAYDLITEGEVADPARVVLVLADMVEENPPLTDAFVAELASRLQGPGSALLFPMTWLEQRLAEQG